MSKYATEDERKAAKRAQNRAWYKKNRENNLEKTRAEDRARYRANPDKIKARNKAWRKANAEKVKATNKDSKLKSKYGITIEQYNQIHSEQNGVCEICGETETIINPTTGETWHLAVDHNHKTGLVRALLCGKCNKAIGLLQDNPDLLRKAADYLELRQIP